MAYQIKIHNFEGPFDLLFHLIEKAEVDIYDIPIAEITNQYLEYMYGMDYMDLDNASEFIVMAAMLIHIKSRMLLPKETNPLDEIGSDSLDPRAELVEKLLEYKRYKEISDVFKEMESIRFDVMYKPAEIINDIEESNILSNISIIDIVNAFKDVVNRYNENLRSVDEIEQRLVEEEYTVDEKIDGIRNILRMSSNINFRELFSEAACKLEIIMTFLALLELIRLREISVYQEDVYSDICITAC